MAKYLVIIDESEAMRGGYAPKIKKKVEASSLINAAVLVLKTRGLFKGDSVKHIKSELQGNKGEYYIDGYGDVDVTKI